MTVTWHVNELKISHKDAGEVTNVIPYLESIYGPVTVKRGKKHTYDDDDDDVTGLQATKACPNYEAVWARTGPLLIQPGFNLRQGPTQPYTPGDQPEFI